MNSEDRTSALLAVLELRGDIRSTVQALRAFSWDSREPLVLLRRSHARNVLQRYMHDQASAEELRTWAEALEVRDDVGLEEDGAELLKTLLFELATPQLTTPLTKARAEVWLRRLVR